MHCIVSPDFADVAGKGRGVIVTKTVKAGTLLAVGKPLGITEVIIQKLASLQFTLISHLGKAAFHLCLCCLCPLQKHVVS